MPSKSWATQSRERVESLAEVTGSKPGMQEWVNSYMKQRKEVVKVVVQGTGAPDCGIGFHAHVYCLKHLTLDGKPCPVHWKVAAEGDMMHVQRLCEQGSADFFVEHGSLDRMVRGVSAAQRLEVKKTSGERPLRALGPPKCVRWPKMEHRLP